MDTLITLLQTQPAHAAARWKDLFPFQFLAWWPYEIAWVVGTLALTWFTSGPLVRSLVGPPPAAATEGTSARGRFDAGAVIGKCENLLAITLVLAGQYESLGLILGAKTIARIDQVKQNASYYLGGTLVNFSFSVLMGFVAKLPVVGL